MQIADPEKHREIAARIESAVREAREVLDALDDTPTNGFTDVFYASGYWNLESVLRELLESCEQLNWRAMAERPERA
jgi:hypothetical protein